MKNKFYVPAFLLLIISLCIFILLPFKAQTAGDDYFYAYSVKKTLATGHIQISEAATATSVFPIIWASLLSALFGFSFETLHASTLFFLPITSVTAFFLLREFKVKSRMALFGSIFFISIPFIFQYAFTFLTDFPFLALEMLSLLFLAKGLKSGSPKGLLLGSIVSSLAFLTRQVGIFIPISAVVIYIFTAKNILISKKLINIFAISVVPAIAVIFYIAVFREGTVSQHVMNKRVSEIISELLFIKSLPIGMETWLRIIYICIEYIWQALGLFSLFAIAIVASNIERYLTRKTLKPLTLSIFAFVCIVLLEKIIYQNKTFLGFPLVLYRYESLYPMPWPNVWKYLVMITFLFLTTETFLNFHNLKISRTAMFLLTSCLLFLGSTALAGVDPKRYVMTLLPFFLIYLAVLSKKLKISGLIAIPILIFVLTDSLQMTKVRYDTNALAQQKALELVNRGISIDRVLPNLEHTWSLWYTIEDKYNLELQKAGGDKLKVKYPLTPGNQDYLIVSKENLRYGNLPQNYVLIEKTPFNSLFVSSYLLTVKKL